MGKYMIIPYILLGVMDVRYLKLSLIHKNRTGKSIALFMESNLVAVILGIIMQFYREHSYMAILCMLYMDDIGINRICI